MTSNEIDAFRRAREQVQGRIADACARAGRSPSDVMLVAVSKTVPVARIRAAVIAGFADLGENRVQELAEKAPQVDGARWHLIGPLQSNKARRAVELASVIQSVDSVELAQRLDRLAREVRGLPTVGAVAPGSRLPIYLQVNVDDDPAKSGFQPDDIATALDPIGELGGLEVAGLMTVGRQVVTAEDARPTFAGLRELAGRLRVRAPWLGPGLSMGMSEDFPIAVEEGATVVRVGRAIFGERFRPADEG